MSVQVLTRSIGGIAQYSCPRGQYMVGNATRTCLKKGTWSGTLPVCKCEFRVLHSQFNFNYSSSFLTSVWNVSAIVVDKPHF
jgi:Sushi domain (SCR repeat).